MTKERMRREASINRIADRWEKLPKGWTDESRKKFWDSLTSRAPKHKVTQCIKRMEGKMDDPGAFCASLADRVIPGWREEAAKDRKKTSGMSVMDAAKRLLNQARGTSQDELHYRAYLRAILAREPAGHLAKKFPGAKRAMEDLIDEAGKAPKRASHEWDW